MLYTAILEETEVSGGGLEAGDAASAGRRRRLGLLLRALYGEFSATLIFFSCVYGALAKCYIDKFDLFQSGLIVSFTAAFVAIAMIFCYSDVSGAHFNSAISFALWLTGKLSNRKLILYWTMQLSASLLAILFVHLTFDSHGELLRALAVTTPADADRWRIFNTEFVTTFFLAFTVFHIAFEEETDRRNDATSVKHEAEGLTVYTTAPQSKGAFVPFVFGFLLFGLLNWGGASGAAMNPLRLLAPAICSGEWAGVWIYLLGQLSGAATGGAVVHWVEKMHHLGNLGLGGTVGGTVGEVGGKVRCVQPT